MAAITIHLIKRSWWWGSLCPSEHTKIDHPEMLLSQRLAIIWFHSRNFDKMNVIKRLTLEVPRYLLCEKYHWLQFCSRSHDCRSVCNVTEKYHWFHGLLQACHSSIVHSWWFVIKSDWAPQFFKTFSAHHIGEEWKMKVGTAAPKVIHRLPNTSMSHFWKDFLIQWLIHKLHPFSLLWLQDCSRWYF